MDFRDRSCVQSKAQSEGTFWDSRIVVYLDRGFGYKGGYIIFIRTYTSIHFVLSNIQLSFNI